MSSKWVIGRRDLPLSHHGTTIFSEQPERMEMNGSVPVQVVLSTTTGTTSSML